MGNKLKELKEHDFLTVIFPNFHPDIAHKRKTLENKMHMCDGLTWKDSTMMHRISNLVRSDFATPETKNAVKYVVLKFKKGLRQQVLDQLKDIKDKSFQHFSREPQPHIEFAEINVFDQITYREHFDNNGLGTVKDLKDEKMPLGHRVTVLDDFDKCKDYLPKLKKGYVYRSTQYTGRLWTGNISVNHNARRTIRQKMKDKVPPELEYTVRSYSKFVKKLPKLDFITVVDDDTMTQIAHDLVEQLIPGFDYRHKTDFELAKIKDYNYHLEKSDRQTYFKPEHQNNRNVAYVHNTLRLQANEDIKAVRKQLGKAKRTVSNYLKKCPLDKLPVDLKKYSLI